MSSYLPDKMLESAELDDYWFTIVYNYDSAHKKFKVYKAAPLSGDPVLCHSCYVEMSMDEHIAAFLNEEIEQYERIVKANKKTLARLKKIKAKHESGESLDEDSDVYR